MQYVAKGPGCVKKLVSASRCRPHRRQLAGLNTFFLEASPGAGGAPMTVSYRSRPNARSRRRSRRRRVRAPILRQQGDTIGVIGSRSGHKPEECRASDYAPRHSGQHQPDELPAPNPGSVTEVGWQSLGSLRRRIGSLTSSAPSAVQPLAPSISPQLN